MNSAQSQLKNLNLNKSIIDLNKDQIDLLKCEFCDNHIVRRFLEMKETFYKIFKNYIKFVKLIKTKDEIHLKKLLEETEILQKEFIYLRNYVEKLITLRKFFKKDEYKIKLEGVEERERKELFDELLHRKDILKKYQKNIIELETISRNIQETFELISLSNGLINNMN